jgi:photosystem II stability/assembly factor-like uncharacterized protein
VDAGLSWFPADSGIQSNYFYDVVIDAANPNIVYAAAGGLYKSTDGAATWMKLNGLPASPISVVVDPVRPGTLYAGDPSSYHPNVYRSTDGGSTWAPFVNGLGVREVVGLSIDASGTTLYAATSDYGLWGIDLAG